MAEPCSPSIASGRTSPCVSEITPTVIVAVTLAHPRLGERHQWFPKLLYSDQNRRQSCRHDERTRVDAPSLPTNLLQFDRVGDRLGTRIHVAQTARREIDARFLASLKETESCDPQRHKQDEPPGSGRIHAKQEGGDEDSADQGDAA